MTLITYLSMSTEVSPIRKDVSNVPKFGTFGMFGMFEMSFQSLRDLPNSKKDVSNVPNFGTFEASFLIGETSALASYHL